MITITSRRETKEIKSDSNNEIWSESVNREVRFCGIRIFKDVSIYEATDISEDKKTKKNTVGFKTCK